MLWRGRSSAHPRLSTARRVRPRLDSLESRSLLSGYNVTLNGESEAGTSIGGNVTEYQDLANFQATDSNGNSVTNPAGFTAAINWGDGTSSRGAITGGFDGIPWLFEIDGVHAFPNPSNGEYNIQITLTDPDGGVWHGPTSVATVDPRPDELSASAVGNDTFSVSDGQALQGEVATFQLNDPNATVTGLTGQITNQTDGTTTPPKIIQVGSNTWGVYDPATFDHPGTNTVSIKLADFQGDSATLQGQVTVSAPTNPTPSPGQPAPTSPGGPSRKHKPHPHRSGPRPKSSNHSPQKRSTVPTITPTGPLQRFFPSRTGYTTYEFVGLRLNHQTPETVMAELKKNPARYFPFPITKDNPASSLGPIVGGSDYKLTPVPFVTGVLRAVNVGPTSFTLVVESGNYVVPAHSRITFRTVSDGQGDVLLEQTAVVSNPLFAWPDQIFGPPAWARQAANLRHDLGYQF